MEEVNYEQDVDGDIDLDLNEELEDIGGQLDGGREKIDESMKSEEQSQEIVKKEKAKQDSE